MLKKDPKEDRFISFFDLEYRQNNVSPQIVSIEKISNIKKQMDELFAPGKFKKTEVLPKFINLEQRLRKEIKNEISEDLKMYFLNLEDLIKKESKEEIILTKWEEISKFMKRSDLLSMKSTAVNYLSLFVHGKNISNKKIEKLKEFITNDTKNWDDDMKFDLFTCMNRILANWKKAHPIWKTWIEKITSLIPIILL